MHSINSLLISNLEPIYDIQSHPQSDNLILSTSKDGTIRLWDVDQGKCTAIFEADATVTVCMERSNFGRQLH